MLRSRILGLSWLRAGLLAIAIGWPAGAAEAADPQATTKGRGARREVAKPQRLELPAKTGVPREPLMLPAKSKPRPLAWKQFPDTRWRLPKRLAKLPRCRTHELGVETTGGLGEVELRIEKVMKKAPRSDINVVTPEWQNAQGYMERWKIDRITGAAGTAGGPSRDAIVNAEPQIANDAGSPAADTRFRVRLARPYPLSFREAMGGGIALRERYGYLALIARDQSGQELKRVIYYELEVPHDFLKATVVEKKKKKDYLSGGTKWSEYSVRFSASHNACSRSLSEDLNKLSLRVDTPPGTNKPTGGFHPYYPFYGKNFHGPVAVTLRTSQPGLRYTYELLFAGATAAKGSFTLP